MKPSPCDNHNFKLVCSNINYELEKDENVYWCVTCGSIKFENMLMRKEFIERTGKDKCIAIPDVLD